MNTQSQTQNDEMALETYIQILQQQNDTPLLNSNQILDMPSTVDYQKNLFISGRNKEVIDGLKGDYSACEFEVKSMHEAEDNQQFKCDKSYFLQSYTELHPSCKDKKDSFEDQIHKIDLKFKQSKSIIESDAFDENKTEQIQFQVDQFTSIIDKLERKENSIIQKSQIIKMGDKSENKSESNKGSGSRMTYSKNVTSQMRQQSQVSKQLQQSGFTFTSNQQRPLSKGTTFAIKQPEEQNVEKILLKSHSYFIKGVTNFEKGIQIILKLLNSQSSRAQKIQQYVLDFFKIIQRRTRFRSLKCINQSEIDMIGDSSYFYNKKAKKGFLSNTIYLLLRFSQFENIINMLPLFRPTSKSRVIWDIIIILSTYLLTYFYSILLFCGQNVTVEYEWIIILMYWCVIIFTLDVFVNLNTAYFKQDLIVTSRVLILKKYIFSLYFVTDMINLFSILKKSIIDHSQLTYNPNHNIFTYFFNSLVMLRVFSISRNYKRFDNVITLKESQRHIFSLVKQIFNVITVAHIASLLWYLLGVIEEQNSTSINWLQKLNIQDSFFVEQYIYSFYWAVTTMTTVGYGDITASNSTEAAFISVMMLLFSCVFAYSINNIGIILSEIQKSSKELKDNIITIQRYLNRKKVEVSLKCRVRHYLKFLAKERQDINKDSEDQILGILSNKLRDEITYEINSKIISNFAMFSSNFSSNTLKQIVYIMEECVISPNEIIFQEGVQDDQSIYFIQDGTIEMSQNSISKNKQPIVINTLYSNTYFGEISFFSGLSRKSSARSIKLSTVYRIKRENMIKVLQNNREDFERYKMIESLIAHQNDINCMYVQCYTCKQYGHFAYNCWKTHLDFDRQFLMLKNNISLSQARKKNTEERRKKKLHSLTLFKKQEEQILNTQKELFTLYRELLFQDSSCDALMKNQFAAMLDEDNLTDESDHSVNQGNLSEEICYEENEEDDENGDEDGSGGEDDNGDQAKRGDDDGQQQEKIHTDFKRENQKQTHEKSSSFKIQMESKERLVNSRQELIIKDIESNNEINDQQNTGKNNRRSSQFGPSSYHNAIYSDIVIQFPQKSNKSDFSFSQQTLENIDQTNQNQQNQENKVNLFPTDQHVVKKNYFQQSSTDTMKQSKSKEIIDKGANSPKRRKIEGYKNSRTISNYKISQTQIDQQGDSDSKKEKSSSSTTKKNSVNKLESHKKKGSQQYNRISLPQNNIEVLQQAYYPKKDQTSQQTIKIPITHAQLQSSMTNAIRNSMMSELVMNSSKQIPKQSIDLDGMKNKNSVQLNQDIQNIFKQMKSGLDISQKFGLANSINLFQQLFNQSEGIVLGGEKEVPFDQMKIFKKFFPHNNYDKVLSTIKSSLHELKRQKSNVSRGRRQNIFHNQSKSFQLSELSTQRAPVVFDYQKYQPTFLSYGVSMKKNKTFPQRFYQYTIQKNQTDFEQIMM